MIADNEGIEFLQWCLPQLKLRWAGFRRVRRQIYKRIHRRLQELDLSNVAAYRSRLEDDPSEWEKLDSLCWISISRFYRDRAVFQFLERELLPQLAELALTRGEAELRSWSAGCAGGEEPYTIAIMWRNGLATRFPTLRLKIMATDIDSNAIERARRGCYSTSSLKQLPLGWRDRAFEKLDGILCLKSEFRSPVALAVQDIRQRAPQGIFHLILCRNLVFTYFSESLQKEILRRLADSLAPGGALIIGQTESMPEGTREIVS